MVVLSVLGVLVALLVLACWWESRSGRPAWGAHLQDGAPSPRGAARRGRRELGAVVLGGAVGAEMGGGDG